MENIIKILIDYYEMFCFRVGILTLNNIKGKVEIGGAPPPLLDWDSPYRHQLIFDYKYKFEVPIRRLAVDAFNQQVLNFITSESYPYISKRASQLYLLMLQIKENDLPYRQLISKYIPLKKDGERVLDYPRVVETSKDHYEVNFSTFLSDVEEGVYTFNKNLDAYAYSQKPKFPVGQALLYLINSFDFQLIRTIKRVDAVYECIMNSESARKAKGALLNHKYFKLIRIKHSDDFEYYINSFYNEHLYTFLNNADKNIEMSATFAPFTYLFTCTFNSLRDEFLKKAYFKKFVEDHPEDYKKRYKVEPDIEKAIHDNHYLSLIYQLVDGIIPEKTVREKWESVQKWIMYKDAGIPMKECVENIFHGLKYDTYNKRLGKFKKSDRFKRINPHF